VRQITLNPIVHRDEHSKGVEEGLMCYLRDVLFDPLREIVSSENLRLNAQTGKDHSVLWDALMVGTLWYADGVFSGTFNAAISRELRAIGAVRSGLGFKLDPSDIPLGLRAAIHESARRSHDLHALLLVTLGAMAAHVMEAPTGVVHTKTVDTILANLQEQFDKTVSAAGLPEPAQLPPGDRTEFVKTLVTQTDLAIKIFIVEAISNLRAKISENSAGRLDRLSKLIEAAFGVARRKAHTIAEAETALLVSRYGQLRFESIGSKAYIWVTSHDERVRPTHGESNNHRVLDGRTFAWNNPPIVDTATGRRRHPGEDFGPCRCGARPIIVII